MKWKKKMASVREKDFQCGFVINRGRERCLKLSSQAFSVAQASSMLSVPFHSILFCSIIFHCFCSISFCGSFCMFSFRFQVKFLFPFLSQAFQCETTDLSRFPELRDRVFEIVSQVRSTIGQT